MKLSRPTVWLLLLCTFLVANTACKEGKKVAEDAQESPSTKLTLMQETAVDFVTSLDATQQETVSFPYEVEERFNWHFTPRERKGLRFEYLNAEQREKLSRLMKSVLSPTGYNKAMDIMSLEFVLRLVEDRPDDDEYRHPEQYFISIFGDPAGSEKPWGWRFEGHHLSLNFSSLENRISVTPAFYGSNPAIVPKGPRKGHEALDEEQNRGRAFMLMLDESQRSKARVLDSVPEEIMSGVAREITKLPVEGLSYADMSMGQKQAFLDLLDVYLSNMVPSIAKQQIEQIQEAGFDNLHFVWAGGLEKGVDKGDAHYYRIHGPTVLVEYDNIQNDANHIHTIWRDLTNDFGEDLLAKHYRESDHHKH